VRLIPDRVRLADAGVDAQSLALTLDAYNDGVRVEEITVGRDRIDLVLKGREQAVASLRTRTSDRSPWCTLRSDRSVVGAGHRQADGRPGGDPPPRALAHVTLEVRPSPALPLETAMDDPVSGGRRAT
jgi:HAE1 family hydrophobic/amphiphilic exporter-1